MNAQKPLGSRPGAMSLLDKYASINSSIEDARRRVATTRSLLENTNIEIEQLSEERQLTIQKAQKANEEAVSIENELRKIATSNKSKLNEKARVEWAHQAAKREYTETRGRIDNERMEFLERCREFRASCKRMKVAASIFVLDRQFDPVGGRSDGKDDLTEFDLWRRLQDEYVSSGEDSDCNSREETREGNGENNSLRGKSKREQMAKKKKKVDQEMEQAERNEKRSRQNLIEAECGLHAAKTKQEGARERGTERNQKLDHQRSQLERHRKEVDKLETELRKAKDDIVKANQLGKAFEKEYNRKNAKPCGSPDGGEYSSHFNHHESTVDENKRSFGSANLLSGNDGYENKRNGSANNGRPILNPYANRNSRIESNHHQSFPGERQRMQNDSASSEPHHYASVVLKEITPESTQGQRKTLPAQHPHRGGRVRSQRQFGTAVKLSLDSATNTMPIGAKDDDVGVTSLKPFGGTGTFSSDVMSSSSDSSSDDDIMSFSIFGKKR